MTAEAFAFAGKAGVDREILLQIMSNSAASSWMLRDRGPRMLQSDPPTASAVDIFVKDLGLVLDAGRDAKAALPLAALAHQLFLAASGRGDGSARRQPGHPQLPDPQRHMNLESAVAGAGLAATAASRHPVLHRLENGIAGIVAAFAAAALLLEVGLLLAGVTFRFVLNRPLIWSDELASSVFLWLAMLGAVLALHAGAHMRLSTIATRLPPRLRGPRAALAALAPLLLLLILIRPALDYMDDQSFIETPAMGWPDSIRASAVPVGFGLMILLSVLHILQFRLRDILPVAAVLGALAAALWLGHPSWPCSATGTCCSSSWSCSAPASWPASPSPSPSPWPPPPTSCAPPTPRSRSCRAAWTRACPP